ncbi:MAG TPA: STAS domain-containing protein [Bryobacteraceae bacterium]|jgi:anti-sigma B factor antagonist|nr:STAS domain-containing protein [Bryobacteraceae bacterium]
MALGIERQDGDGAVSVVVLRGKLMLGEDCRQLEAVIPELLSEGRTKLIFDLSAVTHIDSTGIGRFIDAYSRLAKVSGKMRMAGATGAVRDSFRVTRLDTVFSFFPTVEEARAGL